MNDREKMCLCSIQSAIMRDVCVRDVQDYLFEVEVLTLDDLISLDVEKNPKKQTEMLLSWLRDRPASFHHFRDSLRTKHPYIVQEMDNFLAANHGNDIDLSSSSHQTNGFTRSYEITGDGNFCVADSVNTRVYMKRPNASQPGPSPGSS
ncbi:uncharacterized protein [Diadema antillarum]|uniref:uncharacterized protein n=2 Tax=Diadema antillarum TaxID=105358 RepID=UPI003A849CA7